MRALREYGFKLAGQWFLSNNKSTQHLSFLDGINFSLPKELIREKNIVYSFIVNSSSIIYINQTTAGMGARFPAYRYGSPLKSDIDNEVKISITRALAGKQKVEIWYSKPIAKYELPGGDFLEVPASKPVEEHLIEILKPELNIRNSHGERLF
ncbi:MAG: hypothetical protein GY754_24365 [bacterium]|nr:hypothetical protein [bacterium]